MNFKKCARDLRGLVQFFGHGLCVFLCIPSLNSHETPNDAKPLLGNNGLRVPVFTKPNKNNGLGAFRKTIKINRKQLEALEYQ